MRHRLTDIFIVLLLVLVTCGCTRNDGDIGDYFGEWRLEKLTADGEALPLYTDGSGVELYLGRFRARSFRLWRCCPVMNMWNIPVHGVKKNDVLELNFSYSDDELGHEPGYRAPAALHLVSDGITRLHIDRFKTIVWCSHISELTMSHIHIIKKTLLTQTLYIQ